MDETRPHMRHLFAYPFRIFFLSAAVLAAFLVPIWLTLLWQPVSMPLALTPLAWHQHEMLAGLLNAAIAGFLLTAVCAWTRTAPPGRYALLALWLLWCAGRVLLALGAWLPAQAAFVDLAFLPAVAAIVAVRVLRARQWRQLPVLALLALLWACDVAFHLSADTIWMRPMVILVGALILVIAGRITPAFSRNWLHRHAGSAAPVRSRPWLDGASLVAAFGLAGCQILGLGGAAMAAVALLAAALAGGRLWLWQGWRMREEPLLWILHIGVLWVVAGFVLRALEALGLVGTTAWVHALGVGAMGTMILGVMTRVSLGHTGRELFLPPGAELSYWLVLAAAVLRVLAGLELIGWRLGLWASAICWSLAFLRFVQVYWRMLATPRVDGKPG